MRMESQFPSEKQLNLSDFLTEIKKPQDLFPKSLEALNFYLIDEFALRQSDVFLSSGPAYSISAGVSSGNFRRAMQIQSIVRRKKDLMNGKNSDSKTGII